MKRISLLCIGLLIGTTLLQADIPHKPVWNALDISSSVPDSFMTGQPRLVTFTMRNTGNQIWKPDSVLLKITDWDGITVITQISLAHAVYPGDTCVFTTALALDYDLYIGVFNWRMYHVTKGYFGSTGYAHPTLYTISDNEIGLNLARFILTLGPEFPGAHGSLSYEYGNNMPYPADPADMGYKLGIHYDLSNDSSHYVSAEYSLYWPLLTRAVVFNVKSNPGINIVLRVRDTTGQVLQYRARRPYRITDPNGWYQLSFDLKAPPECHWGGADDGSLHGEITWLAINPCDPVNRTPSIAIDSVYVTNVRLISNLPVANVPLPIIVLGQDSTWVFSNGQEWPGATGSLTYTQGQTQQRKMLLSYDLCNGGHYVSATYNMPSPLSAKAISLLVKPKPGIQIVLRVQDQFGEVLQYRTLLPFMVDNNGWYRQIVGLATPPEGYWGGNGGVNGVFDGIVTSISICACDPLRWDRDSLAAFGTLEIEDVEVLDTLLPVDCNLLLSNDSLWAPIYDADVLSKLGVVVHSCTDDQALDIAQGAGFTWIRHDLNWAMVESVPGKYDFSGTGYDHLLTALHDRNMKALLILDYGHPYYTGYYDTTSWLLPPTTPEAREAFGNFAYRCISHFDSLGYDNVVYEIWNEENDWSKFWPPDADTVKYWLLTQTVMQRMRPIDPNAKIISGGISGTDFKYLRKYLSTYTDSILHYPYPEYPDAIGVHPYRLDGPESATNDIAYWRAIIDSKLPTNTPTWNSEWGYSSSWDGGPDWNNTVNGHLEINRKRQGIKVSRELLTSTALDFPLMVYYDIRDDGPDPFYGEYNFGLLDTIYNDKLAMSAVRTFTNAMKNCDVVAVLPIEEANVYGMYCHKISGGSTAIIWYRGQGQATVKLPNTGNYCVTQITNVFGEQMAIPGSGQLTLADTLGPVYLNFGYYYYPQSKQVFAERQKHDIDKSCYENRLYGPEPNPSKGSTMIRYSIKQAAPVTIAVYNVMGQLVSTLVKEVKPAGMYSVQWNGKNEAGKTVSNGMYLYRIQAGDFRDAKKMIVLR